MSWWVKYTCSNLINNLYVHLLSLNLNLDCCGPHLFKVEFVRHILFSEERGRKGITYLQCAEPISVSPQRYNFHLNTQRRLCCRVLSLHYYSRVLKEEDVKPSIFWVWFDGGGNGHTWNVMGWFVFLLSSDCGVYLVISFPWTQLMVSFFFCSQSVLSMKGHKYEFVHRIIV